MKKLAFIYFALLLTACDHTKTTEREAQAVQSVLDFYGGVCHRYKGFENGNGQAKKYFELEISQSEALESYSKIIEMPASNIAHLFYEGLKEEQGAYTEVRVKVILSNGTHEYIYPTTDLKEVETLIPIFEKVVDDLKLNNYDDLFSLFDTTAMPDLTVEKIKAACTSYGSVKDGQLQGFAFFTGQQDGKALAHLAGVEMTEKGTIPLSLFVDRSSKKLVTLKHEF